MRLMPSAQAWYRSLGAMCDGWKRNLAALFPDALSRGLWKLFQTALLFGLPLLAVWLYLTVARTPVDLGGRAVVGMARACALRQRGEGAFSACGYVLSPLALPLFSWLLVDSWMQKHLWRGTTWKGARRYASSRCRVSDPRARKSASRQPTG